MQLMKPQTALFLTVASLPILFLHSLDILLLFALGITLIISLHLQSLSVPTTSLLLTAPLAIPLILIHGFINPSFPISRYLLHAIPVREPGFTYAFLITVRFFLIAAISLSWRQVPRNDLFAFSLRLHLPTSIVVLITVSTSTISTVTRRIETVYLAQQARGIAAGPNLLNRIKSLPSMVIPVIISTLMESHYRGMLMASRGLGSVRPNFSSRQARMLRRSDIFFVAYILILNGFCWFLMQN